MMAIIVFTKLRIKKNALSGRFNCARMEEFIPVAEEEAEAAQREVRNLERARNEPQQRRRRQRPEEDSEDSSSSSSISSREGGGGRRRRFDAAEEAEEGEEDEAPHPPAGAAPRPRSRVLAPDVQKVLAELGQPDPPDKCFGCTHGRADSVSIAFEPYRKMEDLFEQKLRITSEIELARMLAKYFEKEVRVPANANRRKDEPEIVVWTAATIWFHFRRHDDDFTIKRHGRLRMLDEFIYAQYAFKCWTSEMIDGEERVVPDREGWKVLNDMLKTEGRLYGQNPRTAMFSNSGVGLPSEDARSLVNMSKRRLHTLNAARFSGTSIAARTANAGVGSTVQAGARNKM